jgi:hypothetical protein
MKNAFTLELVLYGVENFPINKNYGITFEEEELQGYVLGMRLKVTYLVVSSL